MVLTIFEDSGPSDTLQGAGKLPVSMRCLFFKSPAVLSHHCSSQRLCLFISRTSDTTSPSVTPNLSSLATLLASYRCCCREVFFSCISCKDRPRGQKQKPFQRDAGCDHVQRKTLWLDRLLQSIVENLPMVPLYHPSKAVIKFHGPFLIEKKTWQRNLLRLTGFLDNEISFKCLEMYGGF